MLSPKVILHDIYADRKLMDDSDSKKTVAASKSGPTGLGPRRIKLEYMDVDHAEHKELDEILEDIDSERFFILDSVDNTDDGEVDAQDDDNWEPLEEEEDAGEGHLKSASGTDPVVINDDEEQDVIEIRDEKAENPDDEDLKTKTVHPYLFLLDSFKPTKEQLLLSPITPVKSLPDTKLVQVSTTQDLLKLLQELRNVKEIGFNIQVETQAHDNSISLMSISTRTVDYLIDTIKLRNDILLLNEIFVNPNIVKIVYMGDKILRNLQYILHIFMVNMFDVAQAMQINGQPPHLFRDTIYEKWRFKCKIPEASAKCRLSSLNASEKDGYRVIPHYLIPFYHEYKNILIEKDVNLLKTAIDHCNERCKIIFDNPRSCNYNQVIHEVTTRHKCEIYVMEKLKKCFDTLAKDSNKAMVVGKTAMKKIVYLLPSTLNDLKIVIRSNVVPPEKFIEILKIILEGRIKCKFFEGIGRDRVEKQMTIINTSNPTQVEKNLMQKIQPSPMSRKKKANGGLNLFQNFTDEKKGVSQMRRRQAEKQQKIYQTKPKFNASAPKAVPIADLARNGFVYFNNPLNHSITSNIQPLMQPAVPAPSQRRPTPFISERSTSGSFRSTNKPDESKFVAGNKYPGFDEAPTFSRSELNYQQNDRGSDQHLLQKAISMLHQNMGQKNPRFEPRPPERKRSRFDKDARDERRSNERDRSSDSRFRRDNNGWGY